MQGDARTRGASGGGTTPSVAVALKAVCLRPEVDARTGAVTVDARYDGLSDMDRAALEWALRLGERWEVPVVAVGVGSVAIEPVLREAGALGVDRVVRVAGPGDLPSRAVAAALAPVLRALDVRMVLCGLHSLDRGSGAVPAFLAHELGVAQALGLVALEAGATPWTLRAQRRLDGGRREVLAIDGPAVCSVEGATAVLRRAGLAATLAAARTPVEEWGVSAGGVPHGAVVEGPTRAMRPRARRLDAPSGDAARARIVSLLAVGVTHDPPRVVEADPEAAADEIVAQLRAWGELPG